MSDKSIATLEIIDEITGDATPVNVRTCAEAVICPDEKPLAEHLAALDAHAKDAGAHLTAEEKGLLETQTGAQQKATAAKDEAIAAASLEITAAKIAAAEDAAAKATAARDAAYLYADGVKASLNDHKGNSTNPHNVTAAQVGLGNVVNKAPNDLQPTYTVASALTKLSSGERLSVAFGKIAKAITDFIDHLANKSNPHGVTVKQIGAAPGGCGYGDVMTYINVTDGTFENKLDDLAAGMQSQSARQIQFYDKTGLYDNKFIGTLWRYAETHLVLEAVSYDGYKVIKRKVQGVWQPWEWINPPMQDGVEYRLAKKYKGKTVYAMSMEFGALPNTGSATISFATAGTNIDEYLALDVFAKGVGTDNKGRVYKLPFYNSTCEVRAVYRTMGDRSIWIGTLSNLSDYNGRIVGEYTKL